MPQASDELRAKWGGIMGVGEDKAEAFLKSRGFTLTHQFAWIKPSPAYKPSDEEWGAMDFLILEWDYAGLEEGEP